MIPCPSCPWRVDQTREAIPNYVHAKACKLMNTVGKGDAFRPVMACHGSTEEQPHVCVGYLAMEGDSNLTVRVLAAQGHMPWPQEAFEACERAGIELHETYADVLKKLSTDTPA